MPIEPYARGQRWTIYNADALDVIHTVHVDASVVVTDSPFTINTKSDGQGKLDPLADMVNAARWFADWIQGCKRIVGPQGAMWSCLNWRSMGVFQIAANRAQWPITSNLIWDKDWIGPGGTQGLRPSYEMVGLYCGANFALADRGIPDQITVPWSSTKPSGHAAEKPEALFAKLLEWTREGRPPPAGLRPVRGLGDIGRGDPGHRGRVLDRRGAERAVGGVHGPAFGAARTERVPAEPAGALRPRVAHSGSDAMNQNTRRRPRMVWPLPPELRRAAWLVLAVHAWIASVALLAWSLLDTATMLLLALQAAAASRVGPIWAMWLVAGLLIGGMVAAQSLLLWSVWRRDAV